MRSAAPARELWRRATLRPRDEDRLLFFVDVLNAPRPTCKQDALAHGQHLVDRQSPERAAAADDSELLIRSERGVEAVVVDELLAELAMQKCPSRVLYQEVLLAKVSH